MKRYQDAERLGRWGRVRTGLGRILESEDDELAYAYYAANEPTGGRATTVAPTAAPMPDAPTRCIARAMSSAASPWCSRRSG